MMGKMENVSKCLLVCVKMCSGSTESELISQSRSLQGTAHAQDSKDGRTTQGTLVKVLNTEE